MKTNIQLYKDICLRFAEESHCLSKKVGCIIVKDNRIISSGVNGTAEGHKNCDDYWIKEFDKTDEAKSIIKAAKVYPNIHGSTVEEINIYYNKLFKERYNEWLKSSEWREMHHKWAEEHENHAEVNALMYAAKKGIHLRGSTVFVSLEPCIYCMKALSLIEPEIIYYINEYDKNTVRAKNYFSERNIKCEQI